MEITTPTKAGVGEISTTLGLLQLNALISLMDWDILSTSHQQDPFRSYMEEVVDEFIESFSKTNQLDHYEKVHPGETLLYTTEGNVYSIKISNEGFNLVKVK